VLIGGEAGIGKSRLLQAFIAALAGGRAAYGFARCVEFIQRPFAPLRESLQDLARNAPAIFRSDPVTQGLVARLTFERAADASPEQPVGWLFEAIDTTFARLAQRRTIVLLVEDLHWADRSTLAFLTYLADRIMARRLLLTATYRSEEVDGTHPRVGDFAALFAKRSVSNIALSRLDESGTRRLIEAALPSPRALTADVVTDIVRRSQGNPFFAEELVKSALEHPDAGARELPLSIRAAVLARVALLRDDERELLSMAAVLGERFSVPRLVSLLSGREDRVLDALQHARALKLISDEKQAAGELAFRHGLTQEVLYGELLHERVRPLHERIGRELENSEDRDAVVIELAHHWWCAGDVARAAKYCEAAGDRASALSAVADAVVYYERALQKQSSDPAAQARLEHKVGVALGLLGHPTLGTSRLRRAGELYLQVADYEGYAHNGLELAVQMYNAGDVRGAIDCLRRVIEIGADRVSPATMDRARARTAFACVAALDFDAALEFASAVGDVSDDPRTDNRRGQARFKAFALQGRVDLWRAEAGKALSAARRIDDGGQTLRATHCQIAIDAMGFGDVDGAATHLEDALALGREGRYNFDSLILAACAQERLLRGEFADAARILERAKMLPREEYTVSTHLRAAQLALGISSGDDALLEWDDAEAFFEYGVTHGMKLVLGLAGGPYAWALGVRDRVESARGLIHRIAGALATPHRFTFAFLAAAQYGAPDDVATMRDVLVRADEHSEDRVTPAVRALYDAYASLRGFVDADARQNGLRAAEAFIDIGWPWFSARAMEAAGETEQALTSYRRLGALRDVRRLETRDALPSDEIRVLSPREREVSELVALAKSNEEIAQMLGISRRTVEKHVSAALEKLSFTSRAQLGLFLAKKK
jgi:DNA-binding NarL/FixJ family response regulator